MRHVIVCSRKRVQHNNQKLIILQNLCLLSRVYSNNHSKQQFLFWPDCTKNSGLHIDDVFSSVCLLVNFWTVITFINKRFLTYTLNFLHLCAFIIFLIKADLNIFLDHLTTFYFFLIYEQTGCDFEFKLCTHGHLFK